jgi:hypothetical protein
MTTMPMSPPARGAVRSVPTWRAAAVAACAAATALITACSAGGSAAEQPLTPTSAIRLAADQTQNVSSLGGTLSLEYNNSSVSGTFQFQLKPSLLVEENLGASLSGQSTEIAEILTSSAVYVKIPGLSSQPGKSWIEVPFSSLSGSLGAALNELIQDAQSGDPLTQAQELTASKDAHEIGTQVIDGVSTTHYAGTLTASAALAKLSPSLRKDLSSELSQLQGNITWNVWLDSQHNLRKLTENYSLSGSPFSLTMTVTSLNHPVTVTLPPASQVTVLPASDLSGNGLSFAGVS